MYEAPTPIVQYACWHRSSFSCCNIIFRTFRAKLKHNPNIIIVSPSQALSDFPYSPWTNDRRAFLHRCDNFRSLKNEAKEIISCNWDLTESGCGAWRIEREKTEKYKIKTKVVSVWENPLIISSTNIDCGTTVAKWRIEPICVQSCFQHMCTIFWVKEPVFEPW